jgi:hypothetical protein
MPPTFSFHPIDLPTEKEIETLFAQWEAAEEEDNMKLHTQCECGSAKVNSPRHSTWCPKYEEEDE